MKAPCLRLVAGTALAQPITTPSRPRPLADAVEHVPEKTLSTTCSNGRIRAERRGVWREAETIRHYWRMRLQMHDAIVSVQNHDLAEGNSHPRYDHGERWTLVANWRAALGSQLLTPAPDLAAVTWKRATLASRQHEYTGVKAEKVERAIADDMAFLASHPVRRTTAEAMARRREFKAAMRQRIREVAASRDIPDEEIRPVLRLKHQEIARFSEVHGVNIGWLLEGEGQMFKSGVKRADQGEEVQP